MQQCLYYVTSLAIFLASEQNLQAAAEANNISPAKIKVINYVINYQMSVFLFAVHGSFHMVETQQMFE